METKKNGVQAEAHTKEQTSGGHAHSHTHVLEDGTVVTHTHTHSHEHTKAVLNRLSRAIGHLESIKKMVVEKDPTEQGDRALLNLGHTIGHAIEKYKNFELYHGECVALGTVAAAYISWKKEMLSMEEFYEIRDMFVPFYLPISVDDIDPQEILKLTKSDKKMEAGTIKFILLKKIGKAVIDRTVTDEEILAAIEEINFSEEDAHE